MLFLCAGGALLLFIIITCCYLSCMVTVRACFAPPGRRRGPLFGPPWQRDPLRHTRDRSVTPSLRARLAVARRTAAVPTQPQEGDDGGAADRGAVYVMMPDETLCIGEKSLSLSHSESLKSPSGATEESAAPAAGISAGVAASNTGTQDMSVRSTPELPHSTEVAQRQGGVLWSGAPVAPHGSGDGHLGSMWPGAFETPVQNLWAVGVVGGHVRGVYPVEMYAAEPWLGVPTAGDAAWGAHDGPAAGNHGVDIELPPLRSGLGDSDTVHDTTVHASSFQVQHGSPFHCGAEHEQPAEWPLDGSLASEEGNEAGWSRDLYGGESEPVRLASRSSDGEWRFQGEGTNPPEVIQGESEPNT